MTHESTVKPEKKTMKFGLLGILSGGIIFMVLTIISGQYFLFGAVMWFTSFCSTIYSAGMRAITSLEKQLTSLDGSSGESTS
jgi:hypothetical protein